VLVIALCVGVAQAQMGVATRPCTAQHAGVILLQRYRFGRVSADGVRLLGFHARDRKFR